MSREVHVRFCEGVGVKLPRATRLLVLAPTRWKLRRAVRAVNEVLRSLRLEKHPDKTFIGRIERGFDFLGYHFSRDGLRVAMRTMKNFVERITRLYEHGRSGQGGPDLLGQYVRRWTAWLEGGLEQRKTSNLNGWLLPPPQH